MAPSDRASAAHSAIALNSVAEEPNHKTFFQASMPSSAPVLGVPLWLRRRSCVPSTSNSIDTDALYPFETFARRHLEALTRARVPLYVSGLIPQRVAVATPRISPERKLMRPR